MPAEIIVAIAATATSNPSRLPVDLRLSILALITQFYRKRIGFCSAGRCDAVGVEDRLDVPQPRDALLELLGVTDLQHEAVLHHRVLGGAAGLQDVQAGLREGPGEILEEAGSIPGIDLELDAVGSLVVAIPADVGEPLGGLLERGDVAAVGAMD